jgi:stress response protein YsnF|tara:strand:+ start:4927 stop:5178 length:252 start_codon:yes stop_codon:yes gene_type:complete
MEKKVLTENEVSELKGLKQQYRDLTETIGIIEMQSLNLKLKKEQIKENLKSLQQKEIKLAKELEEKYGNGEISLETGEFLPSK